ncbi:MAG: TauD/TfdA family dioxygenase [Gammaproteobacteria bacterium]|nr:TauD/TfdA family dioxygenase [Gammaproteobacteria bacterium]
MSLPPTQTQAKSIFYLGDNAAYARWRDAKLEGYPRTLEQLTVEIRTHDALSRSEQQAILRLCAKTNMALYMSQFETDDPKAIPRTLASTFGLTHVDKHLCVDEDGITPLQVSVEGQRREYIPYSNRPINWHTDGYYNTPDHRVRGMLLHCGQAAAKGGDNALLDHEIAYILLREKNPDFIAALTREDALTIPANVSADGTLIRDAQSGPVFSVVDGFLHMRYTIRAKYIEWHTDPEVQEAAAALHALLNEPSPYIFELLTQHGQGIICNNVLHKRSGFVDNPTTGQVRVMYRARYYNRLPQP